MIFAYIIVININDIYSAQVHKSLHNKAMVPPRQAESNLMKLDVK